MLIYKATNTINRKCYIGQTQKSLQTRIKKHLDNAFRLKQGTVFYRSLRKHGASSFEWEVLCYCDSKSELDLKEQSYISQFNSNDLSIGYNMTIGGDGGDTWSSNPRLEELKALKSKQNSGTGNPMYGKDRRYFYHLVSPDGICISCKGLENASKLIGTSRNKIAAMSNGIIEHVRGWRCVRLGATG
jgi:group I intron endonuclease